MAGDLHRHPLAALRAEAGLSGPRYLQQVAARHRALGFGAMAARPEKQSRWESGTVTPDMAAQLAIASLHGVPEAAVRAEGWPWWLLLALAGDEQVLAAPWTPAGTVASAAACVQGSPVDRRAFMISSGPVLLGLALQLVGGLRRRAPARSRPGLQVTCAVVGHLEQRLDHLRRLDDVLGGRELLPLAQGEFRLAARLAADGSYGTAAGRRLFSALAEAARLAGGSASTRAARRRPAVLRGGPRAAATAGDHGAGRERAGVHGHPGVLRRPGRRTRSASPGPRWTRPGTRSRPGSGPSSAPAPPGRCRRRAGRAPSAPGSSRPPTRCWTRAPATATRRGRTG